MELEQERVELSSLCLFFVLCLLDLVFAPLLHEVTEEDLEDGETKVDCNKLTIRAGFTLRGLSQAHN